MTFEKVKYLPTCQALAGPPFKPRV